MLEIKSSGQVFECEINDIRSARSSHDNARISQASTVLSSRINASALIRAFSSLGGSSARSLAISRICCFMRADFLLLAIWRRVMAILSWVLSLVAL